MGPGFESPEVHQILIISISYIVKEKNEEYREVNISLPPVASPVGVFNAQGPPVPIPNTEVKLCGAEDTCTEACRENRSMPT